MTNTNESIWKDVKEIPRADTEILCACSMGLYNVFYSWHDENEWGNKVKQYQICEWLYFEDVQKAIAQFQQSESLKTENERLRKALGEAINFIDKKYCFFRPGQVIAYEIKEILTAALAQPKDK